MLSLNYSKEQLSDSFCCMGQACLQPVGVNIAHSFSVKTIIWNIG